MISITETVIISTPFLLVSVVQVFISLLVLKKISTSSATLPNDKPQKSSLLAKIKPPKKFDPVVMDDAAIIALEDEKNRKKSRLDV